MGVSSISKIIRETCEIIWTQLHPIEMAPPITEQWVDIAAGYFEKSQFPNCVGAVDGKHIRLECPQNRSYDKESDCNIFKQSSYGKKLYSGHVNFPCEKTLPGDERGVPQRFVLVGDEVFALSKHLLRPFPGRKLNDERLEPDFAILITKASCVLHNFVRRRDGIHIEDTVNCMLGDVNEKKGVENSPLEAKNVREYFAKYLNKPEFSLS
ncbi:hypothetical protein AGLY_011586 [Aphis glycines]|uniref:DDE Tnp4 domain-containing protein n=1 Tax=Aphis glycines TaxID=307491 RepID=A0A6G0TC49_APHGL|nr:hypothetical protein AGLY_011586 [Aphis glycines]